MDEKLGSSSTPLTEKRCDYCKKTGDLNLKCKSCEKMSLPPMLYCSPACEISHRTNPERLHICGAEPPAGASSSGRAEPPAAGGALMLVRSSKSGQQKAVGLPPLIDIDDTTARRPCTFCGEEGQKICGPCGRETSRPTFYCSMECQKAGFYSHRHACGLEYPTKVDPMNGIV
jgi:hypothetical protein